MYEYHLIETELLCMSGVLDLFLCRDLVQITHSVFPCPPYHLTLYYSTLPISRREAGFYTVSQKSPPFCFSNNSQQYV